MRGLATILSRLLAEAPRWLLLFVLVWAPWAYGSTRDWTVLVFNQLLGVVVALWLASLVLRRMRPVIHPVLLLGALFLIAQGWLMIWNAGYTYDRANLKFIEIPAFWRSGPSALDIADAVPMMLRMTSLLLTMCFVCDLARRPVWRRRLWWTVGLVGLSLIVFGLGRKVLGIELASEDPEEMGVPFKTSFALYLYRGNAAAFINLVLPIVGGLASLAFSRGGSAIGRALWPAAVLLCIAGATVTASKIGMMITAAILLTMVVWETRRLLRSRSVTILQATAFAVVALAITGSAIAFGWHRAKLELARLPGLAGENTWQDRVIASQVCLRMMPDAGLWGIGPGNFAITFPHYTNYLGDRIEGVWDDAHMDYLQTAVEWGWVGAGVWTILLFGGLALGLREYLRSEPQPSRGDMTMIFATWVAVLGIALHAAVDFPLQIPSLQLYTAAFLGLLWGAGKWLPSPALSNRQRHG